MYGYNTLVSYFLSGRRDMLIIYSPYHCTLIVALFYSYDFRW